MEEERDDLDNKHVRLLCSCKDAALRFGWRQVGLQKVSFV